MLLLPKRLMHTQRVIENLLLVTGASRAMLELVRPDGTLKIVAEAVQHGQRQIRHYPPAQALLDARTLERLRRDKDFLVEHNTGAPRASDSEGISARMLAPLIRGGPLVGVISLHHCADPDGGARRARMPCTMRKAEFSTYRRRGNRGNRPRRKTCGPPERRPFPVVSGLL